MNSDRYDYFVPNVTNDYIWFKRTQSSRRGTSARCSDRCWASVVNDGPAVVWRWLGVRVCWEGIHSVVDPGVCWDLQYCVIMLLFGCLVQHICFLPLAFWSDL